MASRRDAEADAQNDYWTSTRRPLTSLVFLAPLLALYEAGVIWLGGRDPDALRNGADHWMRGWLQQAGADQPYVLPALIVVGLLVWHVAGRHRWHVGIETLIGMFAESLLFAFVLVVLGQLQDFAFRQWGPVPTSAIAADLAAAIPAAIATDRAAALAIVFVGAGIYEEVLFRLCLLPACYALFRAGRVSRGWAWTLAIIATSLAFSLAHYVGPSGEEFRLFTFGFRAVAGLFFAALFVLRGFGITVGAHAAYDIIVGLLMAGGTGG